MHLCNVGFKLPQPIYRKDTGSCYQYNGIIQKIHNKSLSKRVLTCIVRMKLLRNHYSHITHVVLAIQRAIQEITWWNVTHDMCSVSVLQALQKYTKQISIYVIYKITQTFTLITTLSLARPHVWTVFLKTDIQLGLWFFLIIILNVAALWFYHLLNMNHETYISELHQRFCCKRTSDVS